MTITAKVRKRMIETGRLVHALVQGESGATTIVFKIEGETDLIAEDTLYLYLLYKRPNDQTVQLPILLTKVIEDDIIYASFSPGAYFTANEGPVEISVIATSSEAVLGGSGEVTNTLLWSSFPAWLLVAPSQLADSSTIIEENVFTQYLAELEAESDEAKAYASDAEEFAKGTRSDGETVPHASSGSGDNAKAYKNLAKDWAMKTGGPVEGVEMSAKVYAASSQNYATESQQWANKMDGKVLGTDYSAKYYAGEASDSATAAGLSADSAAASAGIVSDHATAIDAIYADLTNIDAVATDIQDDDSVIDAVAHDLAKVTAVADDLTNIDAVNSNKTNINTIAGSISNVNSVAGNIANVNAVAGNATNINAVKTNESNINKVAAIDGDVSMVAAIDDDVSKVADIYGDVSAVAAIDSDVTAVSGIKTDVSAVANVASDVETVADELTDIGTVATNISDVSAVADDITKVTAVADDLTNIDAVADDLTNIDNAVNYALEAEGFAVGEQNGTPVSSGSPYYQNNAKYYSQEVPALKSAIYDNFLSCVTSGVFSIYRFTQHNGNLANGGIWNNVNSSFKHVVIPVYSGLSLKLKTASNSPICGNFGFVKTYSEPSEGGTVDYSSQEGYTDKFVMGGQLEFSLTCPSDCKYLILENYYFGAYTPFIYLYLGNRNLLEDISEKSIKYVGDISYLGITTLSNLQERGYYNCPATYLSSLTDLPTELTASQGFDLFVFPHSAAGGVAYQLLINNAGLAWFRYGQNEFKPFNHRLVSDDITWYALGDSITQGVYSTGPNQSAVTSENWVNLVASKTGFRVTNYGVGGSGYVDNTHATDGKNAREKADTIDFSTCDLVTLAYGINDWKYGYPLGSMSDNIADGGTMYANMRYVIEKIITDNPNCKILVITPLNCMGYAFDYGNESTNWGLGYTISGNGKTLQDFYNGMKEICDYYGIELVDQTHTSVVNRKSIIGTLLDGVHPSLDCHKALGHELAKKIKFM